MCIPYHPGIKATIDGIATHILSHQEQSQTNAVKAQDYDNSVLGSAQCFAGGLRPQEGTTISCSGFGPSTIQTRPRHDLAGQRLPLESTSLPVPLLNDVNAILAVSSPVIKTGNRPEKRLGIRPGGSLL
ncbi:hypothetical protein TNCV_4888871 [Trichonephila clavipes]|nr:hypothetical protein TNCV_4888871 [Trichonephila clavipes]